MADPQDPTNSAADGAGDTPEKKPPAKAAKKSAKAPAKKAPSKKAPAKKAPAKKAPAKNAPTTGGQRADTNGDLTAAAKDAAAQAKSTVEAADNPVAPAVVGPAAGQSPVPLIVAVAVSLLAVLLIRQLRRR
ncbi:histone-like protein [Mycobacterium lepraemurium]|nr:nucleoid-structuring protein H-NS [Mycobacterium lepraemurium]ATA27224.1 histone-like protein [Mycobacterium lepraemurium]